MPSFLHTHENLLHCFDLKKLFCFSSLLAIFSLILHTSDKNRKIHEVIELSLNNNHNVNNERNV